jgi:signal peptidase I
VTEAAAGPPKRKLGLVAKVLIWVVAVVVLLVVAWTVMLNFVVRGYRMPAESMAPTLNPGAHFYVNQLAYVSHGPQPGDVIVFKATPGWNAGYKSIPVAEHRGALAAERAVGLRVRSARREGHRQARHRGRWPDRRMPVNFGPDRER